MNTYRIDDSAVFMRSRDTHGALSNMTGRMPLQARSMTFQSSEGLYQALKFPDQPDVQRAIGRASSGMGAKKVSRAEESRYTMPLQEWMEIRDDAMRFALAVKLQQHPETFGRALLNTGYREIVEESRHDDYWGAIRQGDTLVGTNQLGTLLKELRELLSSEQNHTIAARRMTDATTTPLLTINQQPALNRTRSRWEQLMGERASEGQNV